MFSLSSIKSCTELFSAEKTLKEKAKGELSGRINSKGIKCLEDLTGGRNLVETGILKNGGFWGILISGLGI